jgi:tRNA(Ile)-lysidine synthase
MGGRKSSRSPDPAVDDEAFFASLAAALTAFADPAAGASRRLCVALSGGRDSVVLLDSLHRLAQCRGEDVGAAAPGFSLSALHINHGLSANAAEWARFCADFCARRAIPLQVVELAPIVVAGEGLEAAARARRYAAFADVAADWLALAHHRDDQAETVLLRLLRGAGAVGAAGMPAARTLAGGVRLVRPLLGVPRAALAAYAARHSLVWVDDESNADCRQRRNFLRHQTLPPLATVFPGAGAALARAAGHFAEAATLNDELAMLDRERLAPAGGALPLAGFNELSPARARNLLRHEMKRAGLRAADSRWLDEALRQLAAVTPEIRVSMADGELRAFRGALHVLPSLLPVPGRLSVPLPDSGECSFDWGGARLRLHIGEGVGISRRQLALADAYLAPRAGGERLQPDPRRPRRSLKKLLHEHGMPPWQRERLPLLWCGEHLVWVAGIGVDAGFACAADEPGVQLFWEGGTGEGEPTAALAVASSSSN